MAYCHLSCFLPLTVSVLVPPQPGSVVWYNSCGRVETGVRYRLSEDAQSGMYSVESSPTEACDGGTWKCVVTSNTGVVGITACHVEMEGR